MWNNKYLFHGLIVVGAIGFYAMQFIFPQWMSMVKFLINRKDGREARVLQYVKDHAIEGNPAEVLKAIDTFGWNEEWLMNVGDGKGEILTAAVKSKQPKNALELGAYCGYSAVRIGSMLSNSSHLTSIEVDPNNAAVAKSMVEYAGLGERVDIVVGTVTTALKDHMEKHQIPPFDFVFIDHAKDYYLSDFLFLLREGTIEKNAIIVADNIFFPGAPDYRHFVNTHPKMKTVEHHRKVEYSNMYDIVTVTELLDDFSLQ